jgi:hypothetical protein
MNTMVLRTAEIFAWWNTNPYRDVVFKREDGRLWSQEEVIVYLAKALAAGNTYHLVSPDGVIRAGLIYQADRANKVLNVIVIIAKGPGLFRQLIDAWHRHFPDYKVVAPRPKKVKQRLNSYVVSDFNIIK